MSPYVIQYCIPNMNTKYLCSACRKSWKIVAKWGQMALFYGSLPGVVLSGDPYPTPPSYKSLELYFYFFLMQIYSIHEKTCYMYIMHSDQFRVFRVLVTQGQYIFVNLQSSAIKRRIYFLLSHYVFIPLTTSVYPPPSPCPMLPVCYLFFLSPPSCVQIFQLSHVSVNT